MGCDTLHNVYNEWTIDDLFDCHEALDIKAEIEEAQMQGMKR